MSKTMTKKENRINELEKHYKNLEDLCDYYGLKVNGKKLSSKLRKLEKEIHQQTTNSCNGEGMVYSTYPYKFHTGMSKEDDSDRNNFYKKQGYVSAYLDLDTEDTIFDKEIEKLQEQVKKIIPGVPFFVNHDARGYAIKINDDIMRFLFDKGIRLHTDFGGDGILAPEIN